MIKKLTPFQLALQIEMERIEKLNPNPSGAK